MKANGLREWLDQLSRFWRAGDAVRIHEIHAPTTEQQRRARLAFERLRQQASRMKSRLTRDEIVELVRSGRR